jgi:CheY-like chemotaxis protein
MVKLLKAVIPAQAEIHYQFQEGLPAIDADAAQLRQVVMNLVTNAAEAMHDRPGKILISAEHRHIEDAELEAFLGEASAGSFVVLEVSDAGVGMDEETRARIFDPFFTTKFKGRGLGMATVLGIVRGHHGAIRVESREGVGTRSVVLLPARTERSSQPSSGGAGRGTVLVVDDDEGVRTLVRRTLAHHGYRVIVAADGAEGVRAFERHVKEVSVVLMDVDMPGMNGFEAADRIVLARPDASILMTSGYRVDPAEIRRRGLAGLLEKPYDATQLLAAIASALGERARP